MYVVSPCYNPTGSGFFPDDPFPPSQANGTRANGDPEALDLDGAVCAGKPETEQQGYPLVI